MVVPAYDILDTLMQPDLLQRRHKSERKFSLRENRSCLLWMRLPEKSMSIPRSKPTSLNF